MTPKAQREFKAKAHALKPVAMIGTKGLTENVIQEIDIQLESHELIKIKVAAQREDRLAIAKNLSETLRAELIDCIGNMVILYRKRAED